MGRTNNQETRASYYGIKPRPLAKAAELKIKSMRAKLLKMQEPWAEADAMIESATDRAVEALDELLNQYKASVEYLNEPME